MRTKRYTALLAFVLTFAMSAVIANFIKVEKGTVILWNDAKSAQKITELLTQDIANGRDRMLLEDATSLDEYAISTLSYVENSESIDDSNLPADFQRAWRIHMRAWRNHSNFLLNGRIYSSNVRFSRVWLKNTREINDSWDRVLQIAQKHGAEIPAGAYED